MLSVIFWTEYLLDLALYNCKYFNGCHFSPDDANLFCSCCIFLTLNQVDVVEAFNSTSMYLDDLLNIYNLHIIHMVGQIYPAEVQLGEQIILLLKHHFCI